MRKSQARARSRSGRSPRAARKRARYHHGNLRRALLDAALRLVETEGTEALTLRAAARLAGVSPAAPYRHFTDKQALLAAVAEEGFRAMTDAMGQPAPAGASDPLGQFRAMGLGYVGFATSHPAHFRVMFGREIADRSAYPSLREASAAAFSLLVEGLAACQRVGLVRPGNPEELAISAWSMVHGVSALLVDGQLEQASIAGAEALAESVTAVLFLGLAAGR